MSRSRRGIQIDRDLERYLEDLITAVNYRIDDQEDHEEDAVADLELKEDPIYNVAAAVMEDLVFNEDYSESKAIDEAADIAVNTAIFVGLERNRKISRIPVELEDELRDDFDYVQDLKGTGSRRGRERGGRDRDRGRGRGNRSGRDTRQEAARSRDDRKERSGRSERNTRDRNTREVAEDNSAEARRARREGRDNGDNVRDKKVEQAQHGLDENKREVVTSNFVEQNPAIFCSEGKLLPLAPVYWYGTQRIIAKGGKSVVAQREGNEEVNWEEHRTDLYLSVRKSVTPSVSLRDKALEQALHARDRFVTETIEKLKVEHNVVEEKQPTEFKQVLTSGEVIGKFYGPGTPLSKIQTCLSDHNLKFLPNHPVIMKIEHYPLWEMNKELTEAVEELLNAADLNQLVNNLVAVMNVATSEQWAYFHDKVTYLINVILKVELEVKPFLNSVITEWNAFASWLEKYDNGSMIIWFKNNFGHFLKQYFHIYKHGSSMASTFVDGSDEKYASISITQNFIYLPTESENFGAASATKLGRVLESATPKLYDLLANNIAENCDNMLVTSTNEQVTVYRRITAISSKVVFMGEVAW